MEWDRNGLKMETFISGILKEIYSKAMESSKILSKIIGYLLFLKEGTCVTFLITAMKAR